ncbi:hypothetical protein HA466_0142980 [Hirschfeldia incana]|nr:hypothetical protein HA466_0142980 [Hirschfeldia incana]KAJ0250099.1 hypothetical protein HA466_0142980 [Hirschfeldia incana]KAJ0250100.1 hypothetical protein HA466_0142980 [Hirschfeldia incana]
MDMTGALGSISGGVFWEAIGLETLHLGGGDNGKLTTLTPTSQASANGVDICPLLFHSYLTLTFSPNSAILDRSARILVMANEQQQTEMSPVRLLRAQYLLNSNSNLDRVKTQSQINK